MKLLVVSVIFLVAVGTLILIALTTSIPVVELHQLTAGAHDGGKVQLDGTQVASIESLAPLRFSVAAAGEPSQTLGVESPRAAPENFKVGVAVSLRGTYDAGRRTFHAYHLTTQCPSRYEAAEEYKKAQASGGGAEARRGQEPGGGAGTPRSETRPGTGSETAH